MISILFRQAIKSLPTLLRLFSRKRLLWFTSSTSSQPSIYYHLPWLGLIYSQLSKGKWPSSFCTTRRWTKTHGSTTTSPLGRPATGFALFCYFPVVLRLIKRWRNFKTFVEENAVDETDDIVFFRQGRSVIFDLVLFQYFLQVHPLGTTFRKLKSTKMASRKQGILRWYKSLIRSYCHID